MARSFPSCAAPGSSPGSCSCRGCRAGAAADHSCWRASFLAFCLGGRPAIYTINIPYISFIYSMYIYNYLHIWRAARNVQNRPPTTMLLTSLRTISLANSLMRCRKRTLVMLGGTTFQNVEQCCVFSRNIEVTPKISYFHYLKKSFPDQIIQTTFY